MKNPWWKDFLSLFFPELCMLCRDKQRPREQFLCLSCQAKLPITNLHEQAENEFTDRFWGRVNLVNGAAFFYFSKTNKVRDLIHLLKYGDRPAIGFYLGQWYGKILKEQAHFSSIDVIVPVPLHPKRARQRGYNQSTQFAMGLSDAMQIPYSESILQRTLYTHTQTGKNRIERFDNVAPAFQLKNTKKIEGQHILLVDDVLTTGATLEACALTLQTIPDIKISMATITMVAG